MNRGFTLLELLMVIAIVIGMAILTVPIGVQFFRAQIIDETTSNVLETLRRAHNQSMFQKNDSAFGVKLLSETYVLFQGDSYALRIQSEDENFDLPNNVVVSGIGEVVFVKLAGIPSATGTISITFGNDNQDISINSQGKIERQ